VDPVAIPVAIFAKLVSDLKPWPSAIHTVGWTGTAMASLYTQEADRKRLARNAMAKVARENESATSILPPSQKVGVRAPKTK
jgi:hypothetical protein